MNWSGGGKWRRVAATLLLLWETFVLRLIINTIPYTEIDFHTYLQQAKSVFVDGVRDYSRIRGDTGAIAYPAGHLYIFEAMRRCYIQWGGLLTIQRLFAAVYLVQLGVVFAIYRASNMPLVAFVLATCSRRLHSIFVLRMFNDCLTMTIMHLSILLAGQRRWTAASLLFGVALATKMNVLLFYPALLAVQLATLPLSSVLLNQLGIGLVQLVLGAPFILRNASSYFGLAYNLSREFEWKWTVNWRFLGERGFERLQRGRLLLVLTMLAYAGWLLHRRRSLARASGAGVTSLFFESNLIGIIFSKSLHYQFLSWYSLSIPVLLLRSRRLHWSVAGAMYLAIELCWNVFPSTTLSSLILLVLNGATLFTTLSAPI